MKRKNYISSIFAVAAMSVATLTSCDDQKIDYQPNPVTPGDYVPAYFSIQPLQNIKLGTSDTDYEFNVYRASLSDPDVVDITWSGDTEVFDLPTKAEFTEDGYVCALTITFDVNDFEDEKPYSITANLGYHDTETCQNELELVFTYYPMSEWAPFGYDEALGRDGMGAYTFSQYYEGVEDPVLVEYCYSLSDENQWQYRFQWLIDNDDPSKGWETFLTAESSDGGKTIIVPEQVFAYNSNYGDVYISTAALYNPAASSGPSYFDDVTGTFYLDVIAYVSAGIFGYGYETCTLNGYLDTNDYTVTLSDQGMTEIGETNYQIINISWTKAVAMVSYTAVDTESISEDGEVSEELLEALVEKIADGDVESTVADKQGIYSFSFPSKGNYTVVAVGFKEENDGSFTQKSYGYVSFDYVTPDPNDGWDILGYLEYTDGYMCSAYIGLEPYTYFVEAQESQDYPGYYRLVNPYGAAYPENEPGDWDDSVISYLYVSAEDPDFAYVELSPQTLNWGSGNLYCYSLAANYLAGGNTPEEIIAAGANGTLADKKITFPFRALMKSMNSGSSWTYANLAYDADAYQAGESDYYLKNAAGEYVAPFCIDFDTLTDDPLAQTRTASTKANVAAKAKVMAQTSMLSTRSQQNKNARVVKFKSQKENVGRHQTLNLKPRFIRF